MPSRSKKIEVYCPECHTRNQFVQWEVVDAAENPPLVARILDGTLFDFTCDNCEEEITLEFSVRFEDSRAKLMFQYEAPRAPVLPVPRKLPPEFRLRRISDQNAFIELARIWKNSLDDSVMLLVKHMLARDVEEQHGIRPLVCSYDGLGEIEGEPSLDYFVWLPEEQEPRVFSIPRNLYDDLKAKLPDEAEQILPDGQWIDWNSATAQKLFEMLKHPVK